MIIKLHSWSKGIYLGHNGRGRFYYEQTKMQKLVHNIFLMYYSRKQRKFMRMAIKK